MRLLAASILVLALVVAVVGWRAVSAYERHTSAVDNAPYTP